MKFWLLIIFLFALTISIAAQNPNPSPKTRPSTQEELEQLEQETSLPPEMRIRLALERADNAHNKVLEDAQKLNDLSCSVAQHYEEKKKLSSEDMKNVGTIEKLAKRILEFAGGSEEKDETKKAMSLEEMVNRLREVSLKIKDSLTAETRHVISASVVFNSNEAINLAQFIKKAPR
jgi:hypothetical protein